MLDVLKNGNMIRFFERRVIVLSVGFDEVSSNTIPSLEECS